MLKIGLTGGIGSGKTTVANYFAALGVPVIDADQIARELVTPGQPALQAIVSAFGPAAVDSTGQLDRAWLRARVFNDTDIGSEWRQRLESILHPLIRVEMQCRVQAIMEDGRAEYCLLSIPLLVESGQTDLVERILVVDAPEVLQRQRVRERDKLSSDAEIAAILHSQASRQQRLMAADDIIVNDADREKLRQQVLMLHRRYQGLAVAN